MHLKYLNTVAPEVNISEELQYSIYKQDFKQRINLIFNVLIELYRIISCSLLILFIPQKCDHTLCSIYDNFQRNEDTFYNVALTINFITLISFFILYGLEIIRENIFIKYLDVNTMLPFDNLSVKKSLDYLPQNKKKIITKIDNYYQKYAYIIIIVYGINVSCSAIIINKYYIGTQTIGTFITYMIFILTKLYNVYIIANTDKYIFYSAYLKTNIQYNDIDKIYKQNYNINYNTENTVKYNNIKYDNEENNYVEHYAEGDIVEAFVSENISDT